MTDTVRPSLLNGLGTESCPGLTRRPAIVAAVALIALWVTCGAISKSELIGRLADVMTHNDVNYLIDGIRHLVYLEINGFWADLRHLYQQVGFMHAPLSGYQAALGFYLFGFHDWAPYASNIIYLVVFLGFCATLLRGMPIIVVIAVLGAMAGMPLAHTAISEFAPEIPCGLFTAMGVILTLRIPMLDRAVRSRILAGACLGLGFLAKPSSFAFVPAVTCVVLGITFLRDVLPTRRLQNLGPAIYNGALHISAMLWLPALYVVPYFRHYNTYFYMAMFKPESVKAFGGNLSQADHVSYYLTGQGAEYMFGNFLWAYVATIAAGLAAASWRGDGTFIARQRELLIMLVIMWMLPTAAEAKNTLFAAPFGFLLAFMVVMALRAIYQAIAGIPGVAAVAALSFLLLVSNVSRTNLSNTPGFDWQGDPRAHVVREAWVDAMNRFSAVILGNAPDFRHGSVYITNPGYYHMPVLWYAFLKKDPTLDWTFSSLWTDDSAQHHIDFIHRRNQDFIIAAQHGNGLTYSPKLIDGAAASEDAVLSALWQDPGYMPIDRFYGPGGRDIMVFQRRAAFGGWRPLGGLVSKGKEQPWISTATVTYLQAYAASAVPAELAFDVTGSAGQHIDILVNRGRIGQLTLDAGGRSSFAQAFDLVPGQNDIVFQYAAETAVTFERLLVIRNIRRQD